MNASSDREPNPFGVEDTRFADLADIYREPKGATLPDGRRYRLVGAVAPDGDTPPPMDFIILATVWGAVGDALTFEVNGEEGRVPFVNETVCRVAVLPERCHVSVGAGWFRYDTHDPHAALAQHFAVEA